MIKSIAIAFYFYTLACIFYHRENFPFELGIFPLCWELFISVEIFFWVENFYFDLWNFFDLEIFLLIWKFFFRLENFYFDLRVFLSGGEFTFFELRKFLSNWESFFQFENFYLRLRMFLSKPINFWQTIQKDSGRLCNCANPGEGRSLLSKKILIVFVAYA